MAPCLACRVALVAPCPPRACPRVSGGRLFAGRGALCVVRGAGCPCLRAVFLSFGGVRCGLFFFLCSFWSSFRSCCSWRSVGFRVLPFRACFVGRCFLGLPGCFASLWSCVRCFLGRVFCFSRCSCSGCFFFVFCSSPFSFPCFVPSRSRSGSCRSRSSCFCFRFCVVPVFSCVFFCACFRAVSCVSVLVGVSLACSFCCVAVSPPCVFCSCCSPFRSSFPPFFVLCCGFGLAWFSGGVPVLSSVCCVALSWWFSAPCCSSLFGRVSFFRCLFCFFGLVPLLGLAWLSSWGGRGCPPACRGALAGLLLRVFRFLAL